jgi:hypothetical protein
LLRFVLFAHFQYSRQLRSGSTYLRAPRQKPILGSRNGKETKATKSLRSPETIQR